jgi:anti-sigma B factor antagonist
LATPLSRAVRSGYRVRRSKEGLATTENRATETENLVVRVTYDPDEVTIQPVGEVDMASAPFLDAELRRVEADGDENVVVDLSELDFIDSTGIRTLVLADGRLRDRSRSLQVRRGTGHVARAMEVSGIEGVLEFID